LSGLEVAFWGNAIVAVMTAAAVVLHRNAVVCALALVLHLCSIAVFFLLLDAGFLFAVQIILYAGAIMVLFLFVIMLLDPHGESVAARAGKAQVGMAVAGSAVLLLGVARILPSFDPAMEVPVPEGFGGVAGVGELLFTEYLFPFEVASILLLVAMIGAMYMGKRELDR